MRRRASCNGIAAVGERADSIGSIVHGTTVGTNALLERRGPKTGVITTRGFRDVLEMRRRDRPRTWGLWGDFAPIVDRDLRLEVDERTLADGTHPRSRSIEAAVRKAARAAARSAAPRRSRSSSSMPTPIPRTSGSALAAARAVWPNEYVSASHQVLPEIREFERSSTTALNAYLQPVVGSYLGKLEQALDRQTLRRANSTSCSRMAASCRPRPRGACRSAPRCRGRRPA